MVVASGPFGISSVGISRKKGSISAETSGVSSDCASHRTNAAQGRGNTGRGEIGDHEIEREGGQPRQDQPDRVMGEGDRSGRPVDHRDQQSDHQPGGEDGQPDAGDASNGLPAMNSPPTPDDSSTSSAGYVPRSPPAAAGWRP